MIQTQQLCCCGPLVKRLPASVSVRDPCRNGGACVLPNRPLLPGEVPQCVCLDGFEGRFCEIDINECWINQNPCNGRGESWGRCSENWDCPLARYPECKQLNFAAS